MDNLFVIYEQVYDVVNVFDIITEDCFDEYINLFYDKWVNNQVKDIREFHFENKPETKINYDNYSGTVNWKIKAVLKDINDWGKDFESTKTAYLNTNIYEREKRYPKETYVHFGFEFVKFGGVNNYKKI
jgi:hypothetical protein